MRKTGLGRGLGSLIPDSEEGSMAASFQAIPIGLIDPNPFQPRRSFDEESLTGLAESIKGVGLLQPVLVRPLDSGRFELVAGERRWRAAKRAGLALIPAIIRTTDDSSALEQAIVENLHRQDLNALEEAAAYRQLLDDFSLTHEQVSQRVGKSRSAVTNTIRLLGLPASVQQMVRSGTLSAGHARTILGLESDAAQERMAQRVIKEQLSVRALEELVRVETQGSDDSITTPAGAPRPAVTAMRPPGLLELEELLSTRFDTRVSVQMSGQRNAITIDFADLEDLERIYRVMVSANG
jgi:ParB family transcriptional regulator, chromosome partitioning protein